MLPYYWLWIGLSQRSRNHSAASHDDSSFSFSSVREGRMSGSRTGSDKQMSHHQSIFDATINTDSHSSTCNQPFQVFVSASTSRLLCTLASGCVQKNRSYLYRWKNESPLECIEQNRSKLLLIRSDMLLQVSARANTRSLPSIELLFSEMTRSDKRKEIVKRHCNWWRRAALDASDVNEKIPRKTSDTV